MEIGEKLDLIHIDQHSDLREPYYYPAKLDSIEEIIQYTFKGVNVGSYLLPAKKYFVNEIYQVRTQFALRNLDKDFVTTHVDSLVVLYRAYSGDDWQIVPHTRSGSTYAGYLVIDQIQRGEYAFGIWDHHVGIKNENYSRKESRLNESRPA